MGKAITSVYNHSAHNMLTAILHKRSFTLCSCVRAYTTASLPNPTLSRKVSPTLTSPFTIPSPSPSPPTSSPISSDPSNPPSPTDLSDNLPSSSSPLSSPYASSSPTSSPHSSATLSKNGTSSLRKSLTPPSIPPAPTLSYYLHLIQELGAKNDGAGIVQAMEDMAKGGFMMNGEIYNYVVTFFAKSKDRPRCIRLFEEMNHKGIKPKVDTYHALIDYMGELKESEKCISLIEAMVEDDLPPTIAHYNTLLSHKIRRLDLEGGWRVWRRMKVDGMEPNEETFSILQGKGEEWEKLASEMRVKNTPDLTTFILRIKNIGKRGAVEEGKKMLETMRVAKVKPTAFIYNTIMKLMSKNGEGEECFELFKRMKHQGVEPDTATYNTLMDIRSKQGDQTACSQVLTEMVKDGIMPDQYSYNILIGMVANRNDVDSCFKLLQQMKTQLGKPDVVSYNIVLECLAKNRDTEGCKRLFREMKALGVEPDVATLNTIMANLHPASELNTALEHIKRDLMTYNILINNAVSKGDVEAAKELLAQLKAKKISPDTVTYNTMMKGMKIAKNREGWHQYLQEMQAAGLTFDVDTYNALMEDMAEQKLPFSEIKGKLEEMKRNGVKPNAASYQVLMSILARGRDMRGCQELLEEMDENGVVVDAILCSTLVDKMARMGYYEESKVLFSEMKNVSGLMMDVGAYNVMLTNAARKGAVEDFNNFWEGIKTSNLRPDTRTYSIGIDFFAKHNKIAKCFDLLAEMRERNIPASPHTYTTLATCVIRRHDMESYRRLRADMKERGVGGDMVLYMAMLDNLTKIGKYDEADLVAQEMKSKGLVKKPNGNSMPKRNGHQPRNNQNINRNTQHEKQNIENSGDRNTTQNNHTNYQHIPPNNNTNSQPTQNSQQNQDTQTNNQTSKNYQNNQNNQKQNRSPFYLQAPNGHGTNYPHNSQKSPLSPPSQNPPQNSHQNSQQNSQQQHNQNTLRHQRPIQQQGTNKTQQPDIQKMLDSL